MLTKSADGQGITAEAQQQLTGDAAEVMQCMANAVAKASELEMATEQLRAASQAASHMQPPSLPHLSYQQPQSHHPSNHPHLPQRSTLPAGGVYPAAGAYPAASPANFSTTNRPGNPVANGAPNGASVTTSTANGVMSSSAIPTANGFPTAPTAGVGHSAVVGSGMPSVAGLQGAQHLLNGVNGSLLHRASAAQPVMHVVQPNGVAPGAAAPSYQQPGAGTGQQQAASPLQLHHHQHHHSSSLSDLGETEVRLYPLESKSDLKQPSNAAPYVGSLG